MKRFQRIMIAGSPGAGKSTLAMQLGVVTGLPVYHFDKLQYVPGWVERSMEEILSMTRQIQAKGQWIFEGGNSTTYSEQIPQADLFIWLDIPIWKRFYRVLRRSLIYHGQTRPDMQDGCPQEISGKTVKFLMYIVRSHKSEQVELREICKKAPKSLRVIRISNQTELDDCLDSVSASFMKVERKLFGLD